MAISKFWIISTTSKEDSIDSWLGQSKNVKSVSVCQVIRRELFNKVNWIYLLIVQQITLWDTLFFTKNEFVCKYFSTILLKSLILIITRLDTFFENWKNSYFAEHMQMDASKLTPPLVYTTEAIDHYELDSMSIVTLVAIILHIFISLRY